MHRNKHRVSSKVKKEKSVFQTREHKTMKEKKTHNEMEISNFLDKEFNVLVIKVLSKLGRRLDE